MLYTPHFLVGAAILKYIPNPVIGLPIALLSHVVLDLIPHYDFDITPGMTFKEVLFKDSRKRKILLGALVIDGILLLAAMIWVYWTNWPNLANWQREKMLLGGLVAILPDLIEQTFLVLGKTLPVIQDKFQFRVSAKYGFISYPVVAIIMIWLLVKG